MGDRGMEVTRGRGVRRGGLLAGTALRAAALCMPVLCVPVLCVPLAPAWAQPAPGARPQGGVVVGGAATISTTASSTVVSQSTNRAALNWQSFDVGAQQSVQFVQPGSTSVVLNQVQGPNPSEIAGRISANGQVILTNRAGVVFDRGAQVNAQSLVVSAAAASPAAFMAGGRVAFDRAPLPGAVVENRGAITVAQAGLAALVAPQVRNSGVISARLGRAVLAGSDRHVLDLYGDGMLSIDVTGQVRSLPSGRGTATALVTNTGTVLAEGGSVLLSARAADGVVQTLVDAGGVVSAPSLPGHPGRVVIAGTGGALSVSGEVLADGVAPGTTGGAVAVVGPGDVSVAAGARISASGPAGGGVVALGTTLARARGGPATAPGTVAARVGVARGATVAADATVAGPGGRVTLLSTHSTSLSGAITAHGGPRGGDGGLVEVSGALGLSLDGTTDTTAPRGRAGSTLLDPYDLVISASGTSVASGTLLASSGGSNNATITPASIQALSGGVTLQAQHDLTVSSDLTITRGITALELDAGNNLTVYAPIVLSTAGERNVPLVLSAAGASVVGSASGMNGTLGVAAMVSTVGPITLRAGLLGSVTVYEPVVSGSSDTAAGSPVTITAGGPLTIAAGSTINIGAPVSGTTVSLAAGQGGVPGTTAAGTINIDAPVSGTNVSLAAAQGSVSGTTAAGTINIEAPVSGTTVSLAAGQGGVPGTTAAGTINIDAPVSGTTVSLAAGQGGGQGLIQEGGEARSGGVTASTLNGSATSVFLNGTLNAISAIGSFAAGTFSVSQTGALSVGTLDAGSGSASISADGGISIATRLAAGSLTLLTGGGVTEASSAGVTATSLSGSAGPVSLGATLNAISAIGSFTATVFSLAQPGPLSVGTLAVTTAQISARDLSVDTLLLGTGSSTLQAGGTLSLNGSIQLPSGNGTLGLSSAGDMTLDTRLTGGSGFGGLTAAAGGTLTEYGGIDMSASSLANVNTSLSATRDLLVYGPIDTSGPLSLAAGPAGRLVLDASLGVGFGEQPEGTGPALATPSAAAAAAPVTLSAGTGGIFLGTSVAASVLTLNTTGPVLQSDSGGITATSLGGAAGLATLTSANNSIASIGSLLVAGLTLHQPGTLSVGTLDAGNGAVSLSAAALSVTGRLRAGALAVNTPGTLAEGATAAVTATSLGGSAAAVSLGSTLNAVSAIATLSATTVTLATSGDLGVQALSLGAGSSSLGAGGALSLNGAITLPQGGGTLALASGGDMLLAAPLGATNPGPDNAPGGVTARAGGTLVEEGGIELGGARAAGIPLSLSAGSALVVDGALSATGPVTLAAGGGGIMLAAGVAASDLTLLSTGAVAQTSGGVVATSLSGSAAAVSLGSARNTIPLVGSFTATSFALRQSGALSVGTLDAGGGAVSLSASGGISVTSRLSGGAVSLASGGDVTEAASAGVTASSLGGTAAGAVSLASALNAVSSIGSLRAGDVTLTQPGALAVGTLAAGGATLSTGALTADTLLLDGPGPFTLDARGALSITGTVSLPVAGARLALSSTGDMTLSAPLSGSGGVTASAGGALTETGGIALAATPGAGQALSLGAGADLVVAGAGIAAAGPVTLAAGNAGALRLDAPVNAGAGGQYAVALSAGSGGIALNSTVAAATLNVASVGTLSEGASGGVTAASLSGTLGALALTGAGNALGAADGVRTTAGSLSVTEAPGRTLALGALATSPGGTIAVLADAVTMLADAALSAPGGLVSFAPSAPGRPVALADSASPAADALQVTRSLLDVVAAAAVQVGSEAAGPLSVAPDGIAVAVGTPLLRLASGAGVTQAGALAAAALQLDAPSGDVTLANAGNAIAALSGARVGGTLAVADSGSLRLDGLNTAAAARLDLRGTLSVAGTLSTSGATTLQADAMSLSGGSVGAGTTLTLTPFTDGLGILLGAPGPVAGPLNLRQADLAALSTPALVLRTTGSIAVGAAAADGADLTGHAALLAVQAGGAVAGPGLLTVATLTGASASASLTVSLGTLGPFATQAGFSLSDTGALAVAGPVSDPVLVSLASQGGMVLAGRIAAPAVSIRSRNGGSDGIRLDSGSVSAALLTLDTDGAITQGDASLAAGSLSGSAGSAVLSGAVGTLGAFAAAGTLSLSDTLPLAVTGPVSAGALVLADADAITLAGSVAAASLRIAGGSTVVQSAGVLDVGTLSGSAARNATFGPDDPGPVARVGTLSGFAVSNGGSFSLADSTPLLVTGTVSAHALAITATGTLALSGATLQTDGLPVAAQEGPAAARPGSFLSVGADAQGNAAIVQTGTATLAPLDTGAAVVRLDLPASGGRISLAGLYGPASTLVLGPGGGSVVGTVAIGGLVVLGPAGRVALDGSLGGVAGGRAAQRGVLLAQPGASYLFGGCEIGTGCLAPVAPPLPPPAPDSPAAIVASTTAGLVAAFQGATTGGLLAVTAQDLLRPDRTLNGILSLAVVPDATDPDLLLPNISDQDY